MVHKIIHNSFTRTLKKIVHITLTLILFLILPVVVLTFFTSNTTLVDGYRSFVVLSGSMEPVLPVGSIVYTHKDKSYAKNDVITFSNKDGKTVTHRVTEVVQAKEGVSYKTKGDANNVADKEIVPLTSVEGKIAVVVPYVGKIVNYMKTTQGFVVLIVVPTVIFILFELWAIKSEVDKHIKRKIEEGLGKAEA
ncbi:MAG: signal peptidase I [Candidatus Levybacteria bacterium]|nr:signal peptidase I [Candidatus Levybacteria bacterium]